MFSHSSDTPNGGDWLYEVEIADGKLNYNYTLNSDGSVTLGTEVPQGSAPFSIEEFNLIALRKLRDSKLAETDWWALADRTMTPEQVSYRQALRDITQNYGSVAETIWPIKP